LVIHLLQHAGEDAFDYLGGTADGIIHVTRQPGEERDDHHGRHGHADAQKCISAGCAHEARKKVRTSKEGRGF
jgi:hypothetical protein